MPGKIAAESVVSDFLRRQRHAVGRRPIKDGSTHRLAKECLDRLHSLVRGDSSSALFDSRDQFNDVPLDHVMNVLPPHVLATSRRESLAIAPRERF